MAVITFLALGANLGQPQAQIIEAIQQLSAHQLPVRRRARLYESAPMGPQDQPPYINTMVEVETELSPRQTLETVKRIELALGRTEGTRWGPRPIDIDIAAFGELQVQEPDLIIPHAGLIHRAFVLAPFADLSPHYVPPGTTRTVGEWLNDLRQEAQALTVIEDWTLFGENASRGYR